MEELTLRILLALSRNLGRTMSIQDLTKEIKRLYGKAYYANTYNAVQALRKQGFLRLAHLGRASSISLNFGNYLLLDLLAEMELHKKRAILERIPRGEPIFAALDGCLRDIPARFALLSQAERNLRLNRIEILICVAKGEEARASSAIGDLARRLAIRIDALPVSEPELIAFLSKPEHNPIQEFAATGTALFNPQAYWASIAGAEADGRHARIADPLQPSKLPSEDLVFNLGRFGFPLLGSPAQGRPLCIELTVTAALLSSDPRLREGAAVILAKNPFHARLLSFLATKYDQAGALRLLAGAGLPTKDKEQLKDLLPKATARSPRSSLRKTMETYHAA
jgi:hypothetical protein